MAAPAEDEATRGVPAVAGDATDVASGRDDVTKGHRADIQALRAIAVMGVVVYHLFPGLLPGGFVGVDVFFVISGFLITSHLVSAPPGRPKDFARFWSRRALRLLPPVGVVILATLGGVLLFVSAGQWKEYAREAATSMLYVENWQLISEATNYLDAQRAVSPFQHFWSLSVEEQYYLMWPIVVAALALLAHRIHRSPRAVLGAGFAVVVVASFTWGLIQTDGQSAEAYFSTWTRMWELGIGSVLAAVYPALSTRLSTVQRIAVFWLGLLGIAAAYALIDGHTPFPGYAAALPTLATAAVILAADPVSRTNPRWLTHSAPVQLVGDVSYALYLWHWPLIVLVPYALARPTAPWEKLVLLVLAVLLAWASTTYLEGPVRGSRWLKLRLRRVFAMAAVITALVLAVSLLVNARANREIAAAADQVKDAISDGRPCFGAGAMDPEHDCPAQQKLITHAGVRQGRLLRRHHRQEVPQLAAIPRPAGGLSPRRHDLTEEADRPVRQLARRAVGRGDVQDRPARALAGRHLHRRQLLLDLRPQPELLRPDHGRLGEAPAGRRLRPGGDVDPRPRRHQLAPRCTSRRSSRRGRPARRCWSSGTRRPRWTRRTSRRTASPRTWTTSPRAPARRGSGSVSTTSRRRPSARPATTRASPGSTSTSTSAARAACPAVIGGVIPYRDENHLTVTYSISLVPYVLPAVAKALR